MTNDGNLLSRLRKLPAWARIAILCGAMLLLFAAVAPIAYWLSERDGLLAAGLAAWICLVPSVLALILGELFRSSVYYLGALLAGMFIRMAIPLAAVLVMVRRGGDIVNAGAGYYVIGFYLAALLVDTVLVLPESGSLPRRRQEGATHG